MNFSNARYYDASTGSFTTQDTYRGELGNPGTLNYYTYCAGDPINNRDLQGISSRACGTKRRKL
ncbi:MAG: hypothetical protein KBS63_01475 [Clostridiales bacterium]|nr:hypothetical protein [Candidatus Crickella caballi]